MAWITPVTFETASDEAKEIITKHGINLQKALKGSYELNNACVFRCLEMNAWDMDDEVKAKVGGRYADLLETAVSVTNGSRNCMRYFTGIVKERYGIDVAGDPDFKQKFDEKDALVWDFGAAVAADMHGISEELRARMKEMFTTEQIVVLTGMAALMCADNTFESVLEIY